MYTIGEPQINQRGGKSAPLPGKDGGRIILTFGSRQKPLLCPFGASRWDEAARVQLECEADPEMIERITQLETSVKDLILSKA